MKKLLFIVTTVLLFTIIKVNAQSYYNTTAKPSVYCFAYASAPTTKILYITPPELSSRFFNNKGATAGEELRNEFENSLKIEVGNKFMDYYGQMVWKACTSQDFTFYGDSFGTESDAESSIKKVMAQFKVNGYQIRTLSL